MAFSDAFKDKINYMARVKAALPGAKMTSDQHLARIRALSPAEVYTEVKEFVDMETKAIGIRQDRVLADAQKNAADLQVLADLKTELGIE